MQPQTGCGLRSSARFVNKLNAKVYDITDPTDSNMLDLLLETGGFGEIYKEFMNKYFANIDAKCQLAGIGPPISSLSLPDFALSDIYALPILFTIKQFLVTAMNLDERLSGLAYLGSISDSC
jgi:hypothetical protein